MVGLPPGDHGPSSLTEIRQKLDVLIDRVLERLQSGEEGADEGSARTLGKIEHEGYEYVMLELPSAVRKKLTEREREVALLVVEGMKNEAIGERLGVSRSTVASYLRRIYLKVGVTSRTALAQKSILFS